MAIDKTTQLVSSLPTELGSVDTYREYETTTEYYDGVAQMNVSATTSRLDFFRVKSIMEKDGRVIETRVIEHTAVIPTTEMFTFLLNAVEGAVNNRGMLTQSMSSVMEKLDEVLSRLKQAQ